MTILNFTDLSKTFAYKEEIQQEQDLEDKAYLVINFKINLIRSYPTIKQVF